MILILSPKNVLHKDEFCICYCSIPSDPRSRFSSVKQTGRSTVAIAIDHLNPYSFGQGVREEERCCMAMQLSIECALVNSP